MEDGTLLERKVIFYHLLSLYVEYIWYDDIFHIEVESKDMNIENKIEKLENNTKYGDYSSNHKSCSVEVHCKTAEKSIKAGSCKFT